MRIQGLWQFLRYQHKKSRRVIPFIIICIITLFTGVLFTSATNPLGYANNFSATTPAEIVYRLHARATQEPRGRIFIHHLIHPDPTPPNLPGEPIIPFPGAIQQQLQVLQEHDRFFLHGNTSLPEIALTFDDGPNPPYTEQILSILKQYNIKASFFCVGQNAQRYPDLVKQEFMDGHVVGNHTWAHPVLSNLSANAIDNQLNATSDILARITGVRPTFFRPPYGDFNAFVLTRVNQTGMTTVTWNNDPIDWARPDPGLLSARVLGNVQNGTIILMHDGGGDRSRSVAALPTIIQQLQGRNFHFVTLAQMVTDMHTVPGMSTPTGAQTSTSSATITPETASGHKNSASVIRLYLSESNSPSSGFVPQERRLREVIECYSI